MWRAIHVCGKGVNYGSAIVNGLEETIVGGITRHETARSICRQHNEAVRALSKAPAETPTNEKG
jgi:hypothetical protein